MGAYDEALAKSLETGDSTDLVRVGIFGDLEKAHVKAHFRLNAKTGRREFIKDYDDARHKSEVHVSFHKGHKVKVNNPKSKHHGKTMEVTGYSEKYDVVRGKVEGAKHAVDFHADHLAHHDKPKATSAGGSGPTSDGRPPIRPRISVAGAKARQSAPPDNKLGDLKKVPLDQLKKMMTTFIGILKDHPGDSNAKKYAQEVQTEILRRTGKNSKPTGLSITEIKTKLGLGDFDPDIHDADTINKKLKGDYGPTVVSKLIEAGMTDKELVTLHKVLRGHDAPNAQNIVYQELHKRAMNGGKKDLGKISAKAEKLKEGIAQVGRMAAWDQPKDPGARLALALKNAGMEKATRNEVRALLKELNTGKHDPIKIEKMVEAAFKQMGGKSDKASKSETGSAHHDMLLAHKDSDEVQIYNGGRGSFEVAHMDGGKMIHVFAAQNVATGEKYFTEDGTSKKVTADQIINAAIKMKKGGSKEKAHKVGDKVKISSDLKHGAAGKVGTIQKVHSGPGHIADLGVAEYMVDVPGYGKDFFGHADVSKVKKS